MSLPGMDPIKGKQAPPISAAGIARGRPTGDELLRLEGHVQQFAGLVQERHALSLDETEKQIRRFFEKF